MSHQPLLCLAGNPGSEDHWWDLCAGPHVGTTGEISADALELESVAGVWRFRHRAVARTCMVAAIWLPASAC